MDASSSTTSAVYRGLLWEEGWMRQTDVPGDTQTHCGTRGRSERDRRTQGGDTRMCGGGTHVQVLSMDTQDALGGQQPACQPVVFDGRQQPALAEEVGTGDGSTDGPGGEMAACRQSWAGRAQGNGQSAGRLWAEHRQGSGKDVGRSRQGKGSARAGARPQ